MVGPGGRQLLGGTRKFPYNLEIHKRSGEKMSSGPFLDAGNVFLGDDEIKKLKSFGDDLTIEDNFKTSIADLLTNPLMSLRKNYASWGISGSFLTPLGPFSISIAWPFHEPQSDNCLKRKICYTRQKDSSHWLMRGKVSATVGSEF